MTYTSKESVHQEFRGLTEPQHRGLGTGSVLNGKYENLDTVIMESANGPYMKDITGNQYIDIGMSAGSIILGHAHESIAKKISLQASKGSVFVQPAISAYNLKEKILSFLPEKYQGVVFCNSGSEATMRAIRLARAQSGKSGIAIFSGGWHGSHDAVLFGDDPNSLEDAPSPKVLSSGIPDHLLNDITILPYNKRSAFNLIRQKAHQLALIIIEPVQGSNPRSDIGSFLEELSLVCKQNSVILASDESITGYRLGLKGAIEYFGFTPDIITYGKILGGGLPIGAVVFTKNIVSEVFGDPNAPFFTGGTFSANPITMEAGLEVLQQLEHSDYGYINEHSQALRDSCNSYFLNTGVPIRVWGCASISRIVFTDKTIPNRRARDHYELPLPTQDLFRKLMILNGVLHPSNGLIFLSFSHNQSHVNKIIEAIKNSITTMQAIHCFE